MDLSELHGMQTIAVLLERIGSKQLRMLLYELHTGSGVVGKLIRRELDGTRGQKL
jgi:hypothetical protein